MIKPIPPKFKVMIAGIVLTAGGLSATRFPADKSEKLFIAHKTGAVSSPSQDSGVTLLRPPTTLPLNEMEPPRLHTDKSLEGDERVALLDVTPSSTWGWDALSDEKTEEKQAEEKYIPFQGEKPPAFCTKNNEFHRSGPSPPVITTASIGPDDPTVSEFNERRTHALPSLELVSLQKIDMVQPSAIVPIPVTTTSQSVFYPDSRTPSNSRSVGNVVTARASTLVLPDSGSKEIDQGKKRKVDTSGATGRVVTP